MVSFNQCENHDSTSDLVKPNLYLIEQGIMLLPGEIHTAPNQMQFPMPLTVEDIPPLKSVLQSAELVGQVKATPAANSNTSSQTIILTALKEEAIK